MKKFIKLLICVATTGLILTSCSKEEDFDVFKDYTSVYAGEDYEDFYSGDIINSTGWINTNLQGSRVWEAAYYSYNSYAEFSSYYSYDDPNDEVWLITPKMNLSDTEYSKIFTFSCKTRYSSGAELNVLISTDFDGKIENITSANWTELDANFPTSDNSWVNSGLIDLVDYLEFDNVHIAFQYIGSKANGTTTTYQLDNIKIYENK